MEVSPKRYRFTGMERDDETGMQYHSQRYYMPWLGRWERADPIGLGDGGNRFGYAAGNPINHHDTTGLTRRRPRQEAYETSSVRVPRPAIRRALPSEASSTRTEWEALRMEHGDWYSPSPSVRSTGPRTLSEMARESTLRQAEYEQTLMRYEEIDILRGAEGVELTEPQSAHRRMREIERSEVRQRDATEFPSQTYTPAV